MGEEVIKKHEYTEAGKRHLLYKEELLALGINAV